MSGLILGLRPVNERRCYFVTTSLVGWMQAKNQPCHFIQWIIHQFHVDATEWNKISTCTWRHMDTMCWSTNISIKFQANWLVIWRWNVGSCRIYWMHEDALALIQQGWYTQIAKALGSTSVRHRSDAQVSNLCLIYVGLCYLGQYTIITKIILHPTNYVHISRFKVFCCGFLLKGFNHIFLGYATV